MLNVEIIEKIESSPELKNLSIDGYTSPCPVTVNENDNLTMAFSILEKEKFRHLPVVNDENMLVGILSERDLHALQDFSSLKHPRVKDCMEEDVIAVQVGASLLDTAFLLSDKKIGSVLVRDAKGKLEGIFTTTDALNALIEIIRGEVEL